MSAPRVRKLGLRPYIKASLALQAQKTAYALQEERQAQAPISAPNLLHTTPNVIQLEPTTKPIIAVKSAPLPPPPSPVTTIQNGTTSPNVTFCRAVLPNNQTTYSRKTGTSGQATGVHFDAKVTPIIPLSPPPTSSASLNAQTKATTNEAAVTPQMFAKVDDASLVNSSRFVPLSQSIGPSIPQKTTINDGIIITTPTQMVTDQNDLATISKDTKSSSHTTARATCEENSQTTIEEVTATGMSRHQPHKSKVIIDTIEIPTPISNSLATSVTPTTSGSKSVIIPYGKGIIFTPPPNEATALTNSKLASSLTPALGTASYPIGTVCQRIRVENEKMWFETTCMMKDGRWAVIEKILLPNQQQQQ